MKRLKFIKHAKGAPALRLFGVGPYLIPCKGLEKLKNLMNTDTFWAKGRKKSDLSQMLLNSSAVISVWDRQKIVGFGRVTSDCIYRGVIWDVIVCQRYQNQGIGQLILKELINHKSMKKVEKIYIMTTKSKGFYESTGFKEVKEQTLMLHIRPKNY